MTDINRRAHQLADALAREEREGATALNALLVPQTLPTLTEAIHAAEACPGVAHHAAPVEWRFWRGDEVLSEGRSESGLWFARDLARTCRDLARRLPPGAEPMVRVEARTPSLTSR